MSGISKSTVLKSTPKDAPGLHPGGMNQKLTDFSDDLDPAQSSVHSELEADNTPSSMGGQPAGCHS